MKSDLEELGYYNKGNFFNSLAIAVAAHMAIFMLLLQYEGSPKFSYNVFCGNGGLAVDFCSAAEFMGNSEAELKKQGKSDIAILEEAKKSENDPTYFPEEQIDQSAVACDKDFIEFVEEVKKDTLAQQEYFEYTTQLTDSKSDIANSSKYADTQNMLEQAFDKNDGLTKTGNNGESQQLASHSTIGATANEASSSLAISIAPHYPLGSRIRGEEGIVKIKVLIAEDGRPLKSCVLASSGFSALDDAALKAVHKAKFKPIVASGKSEALLTFRFCLEN